MTENNQFRFALVGAGRMGRIHLNALAESTKVVISDVVEPNIEARESLVARGGRRVHHSLADLLSCQRPDGVLVAAPTTEHAHLTRMAVAAGVPVLCEKPAGLTADGLLDLAAFAAKCHVPVRVGYWRRWLPVLVALRDRIRSGELGTIYVVAASQWDHTPPSAAFRRTSGGILLDMGVHEIDQIRWLTGADVVEAHAVAAAHVEDSAATGDVDSAILALQLSSGCLGTVSLGRYFPAGDMVEVEVFGSSGHERHYLLDPVRADFAFYDALRRQAEGFADLVRTGNARGATLVDAARAVQVIEATC